MRDIDFVSSPYPTSGRDLQNRTKNFANTTYGLGVSPPKRKFFDTLTSTEVHLVGQISPVGRTEWLLTIPQVWGAYWLRNPPKAIFQFLAPLSFLVIYARYRLRFFAVSDGWQGPTKSKKKFANITSGLGSAPKIENFLTPS